MKSLSKLSGLILAVIIVFPCVMCAETNSQREAWARIDDVIYGRKAGMALTMNVFRPSKQNGAGVVWVVSGGFYSRYEDTLNQGFVNRLKPLLDRGYTVFTVMHGSAPQFEIREIINDIHRAVRFVRYHAEDYGIDSGRIGITGGSAGGYLATLMGTTGCAGEPNSKDPIERESSKVQAVACFFPGTDWLNFPNPGDNVIDISERLGTVSSFRLREYDPKMKEYVRINDSNKVNQILADISPINHVDAGTAPILMIFGDRDDITSIKTQGYPMIDKLKKAGVPCDMVIKPGVGHGWNGIEKDTDTIAEWFEKHLVIKAAIADSARDVLFAAEGSGNIQILSSYGVIKWEYPAKMSRDASRLSNGNILFCYNDNYDGGHGDNPSGVMEVSMDKRIVFQFSTTGQVFTCQRMLDGNTLVGVATQGRLLVVDSKGKIINAIKVKNAPGHSCMRHARALTNGNFIVAEESACAVREYTGKGGMVREIKLDYMPFDLVRLDNGNTIISGQSAIAEVDPSGKTVWRMDSKEKPELGVRWFAGFHLLPSGNLVVCNAGGKVPFFELTRDDAKKIVWSYDASKKPAAMGHSVQLLISDWQAVR